MDKIELVTKQITAGGELINALDETDFAVTAAMWYYFSDTDGWRLILASPYVDKNGPMKSYEIIQDKLEELRKFAKVTVLLEGEITSFISLDNISVVSQNDDLIKLIRAAIRTETPIRFTKNVINNILIEDAFIYRMR